MWKKREQKWKRTKNGIDNCRIVLNAEGKRLLNLYEEYGLTVLNGRIRGDKDLKGLRSSTI